MTELAKFATRRLCILLGLSGTLSFGQISAELIPSLEPGWPQWRGPYRDGIARERGLLREWPAEGPVRRWTSQGLGRGWSSPVISRGRLFITGDTGDVLVVHALDLDGRFLWHATNGAAWKGSYPGARASCAIAEGRVVHLNAHGRLAAFDAETGRELWHLPILERFGGVNVTWAVSECVLVDGGRVYVTAGGAEALVVAIRLTDGTVVWKSPPLILGLNDDPRFPRLAEPAGEPDPVGYTSPILIRLGPRRILINCSNRHAFAVDADTGEWLWTRPMPTRYRVLACTPVAWRNAVFVTGPDGDGGRLVQMLLEGTHVIAQDVWTTPLDTCQHGLVVAGDRLVGPMYREPQRWVALDLNTGRITAELRGLLRGASVYVDDRWIVLTEDGEVVLLELEPSGFQIRSRFRWTPQRVRDAWAHPVVLDGRLYLRYHDRLDCYNLRAAEAAVPPPDRSIAAPPNP